MDVPRRVRWQYYVYRVTNSMGFYVPVSVIYLLHRGYGLEYIGLLQAVFSVSLLVAEVPSGYLGDRLGRRRTLAVGSLLRAAGLLGYVVVDFAAGYLLLKICFGVGWAFRSGNRDAWLYDVLDSYGDTACFARVDSRASTALLLASAGGALAGGVLYGLDPALPFLVNGTVALLGLPVLAAMRAGSGAHGDHPVTVRTAVATLRAQTRRPEVRWVVAYTVVLFLVFDLTRTFEQPALDAIGVSTAGMGVLYAAFKLVSAGAAAAVGQIQETLGTRRSLLLAAPLVGLSYAAIAVVPLAVVPALFLYRSLRVVIRPIRNQYLNDRLADVGRATVLSGVSMVLSLAGAFARVGGGAVANRTGPLLFLAGAGVTLSLSAGLLWIAVSPVRPAAPGDVVASADD
jgi:MFS family permease